MLHRYRMRPGGPPGSFLRPGDDALALVISKVTGCRISRAYLLTDVSVLVLSLSYIPAGRIVYSLITVTVSSFMIDFIQNFGIPRKDEDNGKETLADNW